MFGFIWFRYHYYDRKFPYWGKHALNIALYIIVRKSIDFWENRFNIFLVIKSYPVALFIGSLFIWFLISAGVISFIGVDIGKGPSIELDIKSSCSIFGLMLA
jgi:hypothetical protein